MAELKITIPDNKTKRVLDAIKAVHPIPVKEDPENIGETIPEYTDAAWAKFVVINFLKSQVARAEMMSARDAINVSDIELT